MALICSDVGCWAADGSEKPAKATKRKAPAIAAALTLILVMLISFSALCPNHGRGRRIHASRYTLSKETRWTSSTNTVFDGTYRFILGAARAKARSGQ